MARSIFGTCSANRFISIVDHQTRCFNLCYALKASGQVKMHSHVAVIGCGISGMTCAVAIAMLCDCIVYVFEREDRLLPRFRQAGFRFIHPDLTSHTNPEMIYETDKGTVLSCYELDGRLCTLRRRRSYAES